MLYSNASVQQTRWESTSAISVAQSALGTDKSTETVEALASTKVVFIDIEDLTAALRFRFKGVASNNDTNALNIYGVWDPDEAGDDYQLITTVALIMGQQTDGTNLYADTVALSPEKWVDDIIALTGVADDIGGLWFNTQGLSKLAIIAPTLNSTSIIVDYARVG